MARSTESRTATLSKNAGQLAEVALIERIRRFSQAAPSRRNSGVRLGIGDDCAVLQVRAGEEMVVTTDLFLEERHFRREWHSPQSAGHRCLARGLSDISAMGARPVAAFLSLALPRAYEMRWVDGFLRGLNALAQRSGVELAGGDTAEAPSGLVLADIVLIGAVVQGQALLRRGARPGDAIYVSGSLGGSAAELRRMKAGAKSPPRFRAGYPQSFPEPRVLLGQALARRRLATACIDISDGLSTDLAHLCRASHVGAEIISSALPVHTAVDLSEALHGGEDYELLFTSSGRVPRTIAGVPITRIGGIVSGRKIILDGKRLQPGGWEHFRT